MKILSPNKKAFIQNLYKAYIEGIYADTPQNRKLGRVGMTYSQYAEKKYKEDEGGDKERNHDKKYYQEEIKKLAEKAYKSGKKAIPFSDEDTRNLIKEAEKEWGLNFSSDICEIWTNTYHKFLFADMIKESKDKKENGSSIENKDISQQLVEIDNDIDKYKILIEAEKDNLEYQESLEETEDIKENKEIIKNKISQYNQQLEELINSKKEFFVKGNYWGSSRWRKLTFIEGKIIDKDKGNSKIYTKDSELIGFKENGYIFLRNDYKIIEKKYANFDYQIVKK